MELKSVFDFFNEQFPLKSACKWDNPGMQNKVSYKTKLDKMLIALDTTKEVVDYAATNGVNLIVNHHPFAFNGYKTEKNNSYKKELFERLEASNIGVYACHTNFDMSKLGMNQQLLNDLGAVDINAFGTEDLGAIGKLNEIVTMKKLIARLKNYYGFDGVMYYGDLTKKMTNLVVCAGAGGDLLDEIDADKIDVFITGEMKWDQWIKAQQLNINVIVLNHYMENKFVELMKRICVDKFSNTSLQVLTMDIANPINYL